MARLSVTFTCATRVMASLFVSGLLLLVAGCGSMPSGSAASDDAATSATCGPYEGSIEESAKFTPFELQRGGDINNAPINPDGEAAAAVPDAAQVPEIAGLPRQWAATDPAGAAYQYYSASKIGPTTTVSQFQTGDGVQFEVSPVDGFGLQQLLDRAGERGVPVEIGDHHGVVTWADPSDDSGRRLHHVYWEADGYLFGLLIDQPAEKAVTAAREVACRTF